MPRLGVNIDHLATVRQARKIATPDPVESLPILVCCGVHQVTLHLREDRRHIQDHDLKRVIEAKALPVNLEMAATDDMVAVVRECRPQTCTLVPEKREEITTEGGLDLVRNFDRLKSVVPRLAEAGMKVSLFIDPDPAQIEKAVALGVGAVELHTGGYCEAYGTRDQKKEWDRLKVATALGKREGLAIYAGHGLNRNNLREVTDIPGIEEVNIGHSIVARALFIGLEAAIKEILEILRSSPPP